MTEDLSNHTAKPNEILSPEQVQAKVTEIFDEEKEKQKVEQIFQSYENSGSMSGIAGYFSNFFIRLPGGWTRDTSKLSADKLAQQEEDDRMPSEVYPDEPTRAQFYEDIDKTIEELDLNVDKIKQMQDSIPSALSNNKEYLKKMYELYVYIAPIFIALRKKGYSDEYLTR